jgi:hypothetical protein
LHAYHGEQRIILRRLILLEQTLGERLQRLASLDAVDEAGPYAVRGDGDDVTARDISGRCSVDAVVDGNDPPATPPRTSNCMRDGSPAGSRRSRTAVTFPAPVHSSDPAAQSNATRVIAAPRVSRNLSWQRAISALTGS